MREKDKIIMETKISLVNKFIECFYKSFKMKDLLNIYTNHDMRNHLSNPVNIFGHFNELNSTELPMKDIGAYDVESFRDFIDNHNKSYDLILGDFPFNMKAVKYNGIPFNQEWINMFQSLHLLNDNGFAFFTFTPGILYLQRAENFLQYLNDNNFHFNAIINLPSKILEPLTGIDIHIGMISKNKNNLFYAAEILNSNNIDNIVGNLKENINTNNLESGLFIKREKFKGFKTYKYELEVEKLSGFYKDYKKYKMCDVALSINLPKTGETHKDSENAIYLPKLGTSKIQHDLNKVSIKHHNVFQIIFNKDIIDSKYAESFFNSELGDSLRKSITEGAFIKNISKKDISEVVFPIPPISQQKIISESSSKIELLMNKIISFNKDISINPNSAFSILENLDKMLEQIDELSESDKILSLIRNDENRKTEFKQTLSFCIRQKQQKDYIEDEIYKTICSFLNTDGGTLLIGVHDDGHITGINDEVEKLYKGKVDNFKKHYKNKLKVRIGEQFYPLVKGKIINIDGKLIYRINCESLKLKKSIKGCYLDNKTFWVRTDPAKDKLEGPKLVEYINTHFN
tara:strand:+ start:1508 stop:3223 length:1716 start_codon:yes stop_codon:yes gene_type:complete